MGEYSALAEQFLRKKDKPIYSVGQGLVEAGSDIAEAFLMKNAAERDQRRADKDISDVAMAQRFASDPNLTRVGVNDALGQSRTIANSIFDRPAEPTERYAGAMAQIQDNPRAQIAAGPGVMDLAKQFQAPKPTYQNVDGLGLVEIPGDGSGPKVALGTPKAPVEPKRYVVNGALVDQEGKPLYTAPKTEAQKTPVEIYESIVGKLEPGMTAEVGPDGNITRRQIPMPGASKDPETIESTRVKDLELSLPKASAALESSVGEFNKTIAAIDDVLSPENATGLGDVTGFGGTAFGKLFTLPGGAGERVQGRLDQIRGRTFIAGLNALKATSPTGATGLGAASEREGENVIQAQAALNQAQSDEDYANALKEYRKALVGAKERLAGTFRQEYAPVLPQVQEQATRGVSGSWGEGETKVIAGARVTRLD